MKPRLDCVDAGSDYCPCFLAETGDCMMCSLLQGEEFCHCNWSGICIYSEYVMNGNKRKKERDNQEGIVEEIKKISENGFIVKIKTSKTLARHLREPGAYVLLKGHNLPDYFDTPMSIMDVDEDNGYVYIAYQVMGIKTRKLESSKERLTIRGPYWNGLFGIKNLKRTADKECLVIARGIAQAPSILVLKKLVKNNNTVTLIVDKGTMNEFFVKDIVAELGINIIEEDVNSINGKDLIKNILKTGDIDLVYIGGSDILHKSIIDIIDEAKISPYIVVTNNNKICCGEGVCGGCTVRLSDGSEVKTCKAQIASRTIVERRVVND